MRVRRDESRRRISAAVTGVQCAKFDPFDRYPLTVTLTPLTVTKFDPFDRYLHGRRHALLGRRLTRLGRHRVPTWTSSRTYLAVLSTHLGSVTHRLNRLLTRLGRALH